MGGHAEPDQPEQTERRAPHPGRLPNRPPRRGQPRSPFVTGSPAFSRVESPALTPRVRVGGVTWDRGIPNDAHTFHSVALAAESGHDPRPRSGQSEDRRPESPRRPRRRRDGQARAADGRLGLQLRRAGLPGVRDLEVPDRHPREVRLHDRARHRGHPDGVDGDLGIGQAGDRARLRHRLHPAGVAEAGRRVPRADDRRRAGPRRRTQLRACR